VRLGIAIDQGENGMAPTATMGSPAASAPREHCPEACSGGGYRGARELGNARRDVGLADALAHAHVVLDENVDVAGTEARALDRDLTVRCRDRQVTANQEVEEAGLVRGDLGEDRGHLLEHAVVVELERHDAVFDAVAREAGTVGRSESRAVLATRGHEVQARGQGRLRAHERWLRFTAHARRLGQRVWREVRLRDQVGEARPVGGREVVVEVVARDHACRRWNAEAAERERGDALEPRPEIVGPTAERREVRGLVAANARWRSEIGEDVQETTGSNERGGHVP